jgi:MFS family permease
LTPFRVGLFRWLWAASLASSLGNGIERTATAWLALEAGGPAAVGVVLAVRMLPSLVFGLAAGTITDRVDRRVQLIAVGLAGVPLLGALGVLAATGNVQVWHVAAFSFCAGSVNVFDIPARQVLVTDAVAREIAPNAIAANALAARLAIAVGALAAGTLIPAAGVPSCYLLAALSSAIGALLVSRVETRSARHSRVVHPPFLAAFRDAARLIVDVPSVRALIAAGVACEVFGFSHPTAFPVLARDVLQSGAEGLGALNAALALGGTFSVVYLSLLPARTPREPLLGMVFVVYGLALVGLAFSSTLAVAVLVTLVIGACAGAFDLLQQTLIQFAVPHEQRGRALGLWVLGIGSAPVGHLEMGALVSALGAPSALLINGGLVLAAAAGLLVRVPAYAPGARGRT